mgnify:FL=1
MGFSLGEIQEHMKTYTINTSLIALRKQLTVLDQQIRHLQLVRNRLAHRCEQMENVKEVRDRNQEVTIKEINRNYLLYAEVDDYMSPTARYTMRLWVEGMSSGAKGWIDLMDSARDRE